MDGESDSDAIRNLIAGYCIEADTGHADSWAELFAPQAPLFICGVKQAAGPAALAAWFAARSMPAVTHIAGNVLVAVAGQSAQGRADFIAVDAKRTIGAKGLYRATFSKADGRWKIASWHIEIATS